MSIFQKTLNGPVSFRGRGLHTGLEVEINVLPADADHGIVFRRVDLEGRPSIPALSDFVTDTSRGTTIERGGAKVSTIEHLMAALWHSGIDNALIEINGPEVPIMDGSAREYVAKIDEIGMLEQDVLINYYRVTEKLSYSIPEKGVEIEIFPDEEFSVSIHIDYGSCVLGNQYATFNSKTDFAKDIAPCRTFVFLHELEPLFNMNLIKGGDLDNAIIVVEYEPSEAEINRLTGLFNKKDIHVKKSGYLSHLDLRFHNEPARHKLLDILGDTALLGFRIKGRIMATKPGHKANTELVKLMKKTMRKEGVKPTLRYNPGAEPVCDINRIMEILPHRPPFLLVDKIMHLNDESVVGIKNVTMNEPFFIGHFPEEPVMPGVLIIEAMAQCGGILALHNVPDPENYSTYFLRIDGVKFKRKVVPGDTLQFELRLTEPVRRGIVSMEARTFVAGHLACEAMLMAQIAKTK